MLHWVLQIDLFPRFLLQKVPKNGRGERRGYFFCWRASGERIHVPPSEKET